ncbi:cytochrome b [Pontibacterium sp.]|uniref:cytochrome b n=1 Tax=Pontibacterium sp. TaxID=2036026 RepID=UPI003512D9FC
MTGIRDAEFKYGAVTKVLHWGMALMLLTLVVVGSYMTGLDKTDPSRLQLMGMHKSFGAIFMQLAVFRVIWSRISARPQLPEVLSGWEKRLSRAITALLYILMLAVPFSGMAMSNFSGFPVSLFGLVEFPMVFTKNPEMAGLAKQAHVAMVYALMGAIVLHVAGALKHRYLDDPKADVLPRMTSLKPRV